jgi:hypothetical protein
LADEWPDIFADGAVLVVFHQAILVFIVMVWARGTRHAPN